VNWIKKSFSLTITIYLSVQRYKKYLITNSYLDFFVTMNVLPLTD
jgi:hypothetical protein